MIRWCLGRERRYGRAGWVGHCAFIWSLYYEITLVWQEQRKETKRKKSRYLNLLPRQNDNSNLAKWRGKESLGGDAGGGGGGNKWGNDRVRAKPFALALVPNGNRYNLNRDTT